MVGQKTERVPGRNDQTAGDDCSLLDDYTLDLATMDSLPTWPRLCLPVYAGILHKFTSSAAVSVSNFYQSVYLFLIIIKIQV